MKRNGKGLLAMLLCIVICMGLCACGGKDDTSGNSGVEEGTVEVQLWATYGTRGLDYMQPMIDAFNASQSDYFVVASNNGTAQQLRTKMESLGKEDYPGLFCGTPVTTCYYDSVDYIVPLQDYLDKDEDDWFSAIYESVRESYSNQDGEVLGYPNGVSCSGWFVNVDVVEAAGYTLADVTSFEKIVEIAKAIVDKGICQYGISYMGTGIEMHDMLTIQGLDYVNNNNGFDGPATESLIKKGTDTYKGVEKISDLFAQTYKDEIAVAFGTSSNQAVTLFNSNKLGFFYNTNSYMHYIIDGDVNLNYAFVPSVGIDENAQYKGMVIPEGTGFYIANSGNEKKMQGAYEFIKFMARPENQATWCASLGYVPNTDAAAQEEVWTTWMASYLPSAATLIQQIKESPAELRGPYVEFGDNILGVGSTLFGNIAVNPEQNMDLYIEDAVYGLENAIKLWEKKR